METFPVTKRLRQGCCISPTLFKIYDALKIWKGKVHGMGIQLTDRSLYTLQFADDQVVLANDKYDMEYMIQKLIEEYSKWGLSVNTRKTEYLCVGGELDNLELDDGQQITGCQEYRYLGVIFTSDGTNKQEINIRISKARKAISIINGILWNKNITKKIKDSIYETLVKSSLLFGSETWRVTEDYKKKL